VLYVNHLYMSLLQRGDMTAPAFTIDEVVFLQYVLMNADLHHCLNSHLLRAAQWACQNYTLPDDLDICDKFMSLRPCPCLDAIADSEDICKSVAHSIRTMGSTQCSVIALVHLYFQLENTYPTMEELEIFISHERQSRLDPEGYCMDTRRHTPPPNLQNLKAEEIQTDNQCSMCQESILAGVHQVYRMPTCGHVFHAHGTDCLGTSTGCILEWLGAHKTCPNCNNEIIIPPTPQKTPNLIK
jgi:hypothetical protein